MAGQPQNAAIYLRVSTEGQDSANQRPAVLQLVKARGYKVVRVFEETASSAKARPVYDRMLVEAHRGEFEVLVVWALDRFGRSLVGNVNAVRQLSECGVRIVSVQEPWLDTHGPVRDLLLAIFSWVAEQERRRIGERSRAAIERARKEGKQIGRPRASVDVAKAVALIDGGMSYRQASRRLGIGAATLHRIVQAHHLLEHAASEASFGKSGAPGSEDHSGNGVSQV